MSDTIPSSTPSSNTIPSSDTLTQAEVMSQLDQAEVDQDIKTDVQQWLETQPHDAVPRQELIKHMMELAEIEEFTAESYGELADILTEAQEDLEKMDQRQTVAELQVQRDAIKQMQEYGQMAQDIAQQAKQEQNPSTPAQKSE